MTAQNSNDNANIVRQVPTSFVKPKRPDGLIPLEAHELPIIVILDLSEGVFRSPDGQTKYGDGDTFSFIPLRLDYYNDAYTNNRSAWMLSVVIQAQKIPTGAIAAIRLRQNRSNNGGLNNFEQISSLMDKATNRHIASWIWKAQLTRMSGSGVNPTTGQVEARKWYSATWALREPQTDIEYLIRQQLGEACQESWTFENLVPLYKTAALIPAPVQLPQQQQEQQKTLPPLGSATAS